jgi:hypothetical protein
MQFQMLALHQIPEMLLQRMAVSAGLATRFRISGVMRSDLKLNMYPIKHLITPI